jgi:hypothetical protein
MAKILNRVVTILLLETIILCLAASYFYVYKTPSAAQIQSTVTLVIFDLIFSLLFFYLNGSLNLKLSLLAVGNFTGLCWNFIFNNLNIAGTAIYGETFNRVCLVFFPFLSSLWIVSFWSLSLTLVHHDKRIIREF